MIEIREDEHIDIQGLPICNNCGTARYVINKESGQVYRCRCKCQQENMIKEQEKFSKCNV